MAASFEVLRDDFDVTTQAELRVRELPPFEFRLSARNGWLVPAERGPQATGHPYWEILPDTGRIWRTQDANGALVGALPFALKEINQNCLHNGLLKFVFSDSDAPPRLHWLIGSETCQYLKFNATGSTKNAEWQVSDGEFSTALIAAHEALVARRLPARPIATVADAFPGIEAEPFAPPFPEHASVWGLVVDGVHYRGGCQTRFGPHPFCDELALPSYSTAKSLFAGLAYIAVSAARPDIDDLNLPELVPECALEDGRWDDVRLRHLVDMSTGNYSSTAFQADEDSASMTPFFLATTNAEKIRLACSIWPRQAQPGTRAVYHTTDTYLLGAALNRYVQRLGMRDLYDDVEFQMILHPARPGPLLRHTQRTDDPDRQPFTGYGLFYHPDDVARLGLYLIDGIQHADAIPAADHAAILFRDRSRMQRWDLARGEGYSMGFWGFDIAPHLGCTNPAWIAFMSGYGGIIWALLPNGMVYYFFGDGGHARWMDAVIEANKIQPICT